MPLPEGDQTGEAKFRTDWRGRRILQVAYEEHRDHALGGPMIKWRDATQRDLYRTRFMRDRRKLEPLI